MKKEQKEAIQKVLEEMDTISTQQEYMNMCFQLCCVSMDNIMTGKAPIETMAMLRVMLMFASQKDISYRTASRKSSDILFSMFKGIMDIEKRFDNGEDVSMNDIVEAAVKAAAKAGSNV